MAISAASSNLIGTPASPTTVAAGGTVSATLSLSSGQISGRIDLRVINGSSAPTTNGIVTFSVSDDGTNAYSQGGSFVVPIVASTTNDYSHDGTVTERTITASYINGATNSVQVYAQATIVSGP